MWRQGNRLALLVGMKTDAANLEKSMEVPKTKNETSKQKQLKIELLCDPAIALLGIYPKDTKIQLQRGYMYPTVYSSTVNNSQTMGTHPDTHTHTHTHTHTRFKRRENQVFSQDEPDGEDARCASTREEKQVVAVLQSDLSASPIAARLCWTRSCLQEKYLRECLSCM